MIMMIMMRRRNNKKNQSQQACTSAMIRRLCKPSAWASWPACREHVKSIHYHHIYHHSSPICQQDWKCIAISSLAAWPLGAAIAIGKGGVHLPWHLLQLSELIIWPPLINKIPESAYRQPWTSKLNQTSHQHTLILLIYETLWNIHQLADFVWLRDPNISSYTFPGHPSDMHSSTAGPWARRSWKPLVITVSEPMRKASAGTSPESNGKSNGKSLCFKIFFDYLRMWYSYNLKCVYIYIHSKYMIYGSFMMNAGPFEGRCWDMFFGTAASTLEA